MDPSDRGGTRSLLFDFAAAVASAAPLPLGPLECALRLAAAAILRRHPDLARDLESRPAARLVIVPADLPFSIIIQTGVAPIRLRLVRTARAPEADARITGSLVSLVDLAEGRVDGDALFFSRRLRIEGDTEAVVELRNMLERAEIALGADLLADFAAAPGPLRRLRQAAGGAVARGGAAP